MEDATLSLLHCHWAPFRCRRQQLPYLVLPSDICHLPSQPVTSASKMTPHLTLRHVILLFASLLHLSLLGASANCTANCLHSSRREWPTFDFDFYYEHSGDGPPPAPTSQPESTVISYSIHPSIINPSPSSSPSLSPSPSTSFSAADSHTSTSAAPNLSLSTAIQPTPSTVVSPSPQSITIRPTPSLPDVSSSANGSNTPCESEHSQLRNTSTSQANLTSQSWPIEGYLLRSVFRNTPNHTNESSPNLHNHFATALQSIYEHALAKQKAEMSHRMRRHLLAAVNESDHFNLTIWDLQVDESLATIDVIYYLQRDGVLVPYEDALKVMSFAAPEFIANQTGYAVIHKVRRYNEDWSSAPQSASFNWLNLTFFLALLLVLLFCVLLIGYLYLKYRREKRRWLESINKELNRVKPSGAKDASHWNYGQDEDDEEEEDDQGDSSSAYGTTPRPSTSHQSREKEDKSSQYDYATYQRREAASGPDPNVSGLPPTPLYRERLIPIGSGSTGEYDAGYDRISYIRTQETVKETKRTPNILEVQLSKETQSIVKEIRNELNRYNFKKILTTEPADLTTSDA